MDGVCDKHQEFAVAISRIEDKIDNLNEKMAVFQDHIKESVPIRDIVRDNKKFRCSAIWAIRIIYGAIIGILANILFIHR